MIEFSYYLLGYISLISALIVVSANNPIHRIAALVIVFTAGAFIFMLLDFYFLGLTYIIVYVGAIAILFLFVIMMVHMRSDEPIYNKEENNDKMGINSTMNMDNNNTPHINFSSKSLINVFSVMKSSIINNNTVTMERDIINVINYADKDIIIASASASLPHYIMSNPITITAAIEPIYNSLSINTISDNKGSGSFLKLSYSYLISLFTAIIFILVISLPIFIAIYNLNANYFLLLSFSNLIPNIIGNVTPIFTFFFPIWAIEYKTITDIESLAIMVYVAYPIALILIGIALWTVMVGIISICSPRI